MSSMIEDVNHLSREIGTRPGGTEEERLAAMYIAENIQKRSGLPFDIEDFEGAKGKDRVFNALSIVSAVVMFVAVLLSSTTIPALIITLLIAVLLVMEYFDKPLLSNFFRFGISQNVVAKYTPAYSSNAQQIQRKRKVVIVSHYDSGRSLPNPSSSFFKYAAHVKLITLIVVCLIPIFLLIKTFAFPETSGALTLFCVILSLIFILISICPLALDFYKGRLLYNEGANCNASGNAALIEIAKQLGTGSYSTDEDYDDRISRTAVVHGRQKAAAAVPEGAELSYNVEANANEKPKDVLVEKEESLASAKAAIAAFTTPRKPRAQYDDEGNAVDNQGEVIKQQEEQKADLTNVTIDDAAAQRNTEKPDTTASIPAYKTQNKSSGEVPDWFKSAQSKAKKSDDKEKDDNALQQRSRFAHTMDYMAAKQEEAEKKKQAEEEEKRAKLRAQIEAANKAAEEERKKKFAEKEKPFVKEEDKPKDISQEKQEVKEEQENGKQELTLDERFKKRQQESKSKNTSETTGKLDKQEIAKAVEAKEDNEIKDESAQEQQEEKSPTMLPEHSGPIKLDEMKQYAPLDDQDFISSNEMPENNALTELPEVYTGEENIEENPQYAKALKDDKTSDDKYSTGDVAKGKFGTGSFAAVSQCEGMAGATGTFAPVKEELIEDASRSGEIANKEDMVVADADDSVYREGEFTDTGAFAGKGYVDMPEDKPKGIFSKFGKKKGGKHANSDEGFMETASMTTDDENIIDDSDWEGGAFSNIANKIPLKKKDKNVQDDLDQEVEAQQDVDAGADYDYEVEAEGRAPITSSENRISAMVDAVPEFEEQIQEFHNTSINMEVWMVALGSEIDENSGMKAFLLEHAQELRGAIIIDIEALGSGDLSLINTEGIIRRTSTASRLKRYVRQAANKLNVVIPSVDLLWSESSASYAAKNGFKTLRFVGMEGDRPSYYMDSDDVVENIDEAKLKQNVKYLLELIQTI